MKDYKKTKKGDGLVRSYQKKTFLLLYVITKRMNRIWAIYYKLEILSMISLFSKLNKAFLRHNVIS